MDTAGCQTKGQPDVPGSREEWWLLTSIGITLPPCLQGVVKPQLCMCVCVHFLSHSSAYLFTCVVFLLFRCMCAQICMCACRYLKLLSRTFFYPSSALVTLFSQSSLEFIDMASIITHMLGRSPISMFPGQNSRQT